MDVYDNNLKQQLKLKKHVKLDSMQLKHGVPARMAVVYGYVHTIPDSFVHNTQGSIPPGGSI